MSTTSNLSNAEPVAFDRGISVRTFHRPLEPFLSNPKVTEIAIVRPGELFTRRAGTWHLEVCESLTDSLLRSIPTALAAYNQMAVAPIMSVVLPDGERGQIVRPPACIDGTIGINIRKHAQTVMTLEDLEHQGALSQIQDAALRRGADGLTDLDRNLLELKSQGLWLQFLDLAIKGKKNIVVAGATGSGKTTFARSLIERVPLDERLITMEDSHELLLPRHRNRLHLLYGSGVGRVSATDLVMAGMRLSPDRLFLAECRGPETWDYLASLNTGHPGSVTTAHSNSAEDTFDRLAVLIKQSETGGSLDLATIHAFLRQTVDIVAYFERFRLKEVWFEPRRLAA